MGDKGSLLRIDCRECPFSRVVAAGDDPSPADVLVEHGRRTGHTLSITRIEN